MLYWVFLLHRDDIVLYDHESRYIFCCWRVGVRGTWTWLLYLAGKGKNSPCVLTPQGGRCLIQVIIPQRCRFPHTLGLEPLQEMGIATLISSQGVQQSYPPWCSLLRWKTIWGSSKSDTRHLEKRKLSSLSEIIPSCSLILSWGGFFCFFSP